MAKSKNNKILAMALCASVMAGIYASPVLAADVTATQNANNDILFTVNGDTYTISRGSVASAVARNGLDNLTVGDLNITGAVTSNIHTYGSVTANANFLTRGGNFAIVGNTQYAMLANKDYFALGDGLLMNNEGNDERATFYVDNATGDVTSKGNVNANTFSNSSNTFNVAEDGAITAADGAFKVREGVGETVIAGSVISSKDQFGNQGTFNGSYLNLQNADHTKNTSIDAGTAYFVNDGSGTSINGGAINAETLNGKNINDLVEGADIKEELANVAGIERVGEGVPGEGITTIEDGALFVSKDVTYMNSGDAMVQTSTDSAYMSFGDNMISVNKGGINLVGSVGFTGHDGGRYTLSDLEGRVYDLEQKTEHITVDEAGNTTISSPNGDTTLTVTDEGVNIEGNGNVGGDATVSGNLDVEGTVTAPTGDFDKVTADEATVGNTHIGENGVETDKVTVTGADGSVTTIDGGTITTGTTNIKGDSVYSENGYFDNLNSANGGTIGGVKLEGNTVDADKVVTGNTTLDNEGLNVGGQTSVTADGVNVGGNGGTTVDKDGVSIADSTIINDHDVVINEGTDERVSLADVGNRVGNLEQGLSDLNSRVDKLDDRIDKVGAMAAAIANLRTMGYDPAAPTEVAVGLGQYRDETGAALGLFHYPNRDFMLSLSVSTSGDEVMGGIGATWKFGRKSPEKVAEIKKAQAEADVRRAEAQKLAKAEELKAAAKEAKIKAQMERHAKLAAERAAEAEAK